MRWPWRRLRPAVCVLTYPHVAHPVTADHNHGESAGHCSGVEQRFACWDGACPIKTIHYKREPGCIRLKDDAA